MLLSTPHAAFTLSDMPGAGTPLRSFRVAEAVWQRFTAATKAKGSNPRSVLRAFVLWYAGYPGAELPERPEPPNDEGPRR